jgi:hypothetical protein
MSRQGHLSWLAEKIEKSSRKTGNVTVAVETDALWSHDKLVLQLTGPSADQMTQLVIHAMKEAGWWGKSYLTKRYGPPGSRKAMFVLSQGRRPKRIVPPNR